MLSILIPTYNYNAFSLAKTIYKQAQNLSLPFEIICRDDGSKSWHNTENAKINSFKNSKFIEANNNLGRSANRLALANEATYDWLLFLDADVMPKSSNFLKNYLSNLNNDFEVIFGGFTYKEAHKTKDNILRFKFGKHREEVAANIRNKNPYKVIISANFLIKKTVYLKLHRSTTIKTYGSDYIFGSQLKQHKTKILHLENEVYHHGIDTNKVFLKKTKEAMETLITITNNSEKEMHAISLLKAYTFLRRYKLHFIVLYLFNTFERNLINHLEGNNPNLRLFDFYRLGVFIKKQKVALNS